LSNLRLSFKLNLLACGAIFSVGLALSIAGVFTIDRLTGSLNEKLMNGEVHSLLVKLREAHGVLVDSGVVDVETYVQNSQREFLAGLKDYRLGENGRLYILADDGSMVFVAGDRHTSDFRPDALRRILADPTGLIEIEVAERAAFVALGAFRPWGWYLALVMPTIEINAQRNQFLGMVLLILVVSVAIGGGIFAWFAGRFVRPILSLSRKMSSIAEENLGARLDFENTSLEVDELHRSFELMTHRLHSANLEKKRAEELIWREANYDPLTNLPNRRMFHDRLEQAIRSSDRSSRMLALLFLDLDHFKDVNDTLGHDQGDLLLVETARRLTKCIRLTDTLARLGGDEFTIILSDIDNHKDIERIADEILKELARPFDLSTNLTYVSASIGITLYPNDAGNIDELLRNADQAMYMAKKEGRNRFQYFTRKLQEAAVVRMQTISDMRIALEESQFSLNFQPIVDLRSGMIRKAEALIRWEHPTRGWVGPDEFIHIAEETGLICNIGDWVFREAVTQTAKWRERFHPDFQISINTSPLQYLGERDCTSDWLSFLMSLPLPGDAVVVEITEGILMHSSHGVIERLSSLRTAGLQISIDDFGTGYSSLSYLRKFPLDYLKIDKAFVNQLEIGGGDQALCEAIIAMAHKFGICVIAEGVESEDQKSILSRMGCDYGQGYYFSKPLPTGAFEQLMESRAAA